MTQVCKVISMDIRQGTKRSPVSLVAICIFFLALVLVRPAFAAPQQWGGIVNTTANTNIKAKAKIRKALSGPPQALSLLRDASSLERENKLDAAIAKTKESITADPTCMPARVELGNLLIKKGQLDEAMKVFNETLKINPMQHSAKTGEGVVLFKKGDLPAALAALKEALVLNPDPVLAYYELGKVYEKMGQTQKALEAYKKGIEKHDEGRH